MNLIKSWIHFLGLAVSALFMAFAATRATSSMRRARQMEQKAEGLLHSDVSRNIAKGKRLTEKANQAKDKAIEARMRVEGQLDKLGEKDEELDAIADRFNSRRVRK